MTINVQPERSTLSLPGARLRPDQPTLRAGPNGVATTNLPSRELPAVAVAKGLTSDVGALRAATAGLDRVASIADAGLAAADTVLGLLNRMGGAEAGPETLGGLLDAVRAAVDAAAFDGVNLLKGDAPGGVLKAPAGPDGGDELIVRGYDLRPGGPIVSIDPEAEPRAAASQIEGSIARAEGARQGLREDSKRVEAHRAFVGMLSDAVAGGAPSLDVDGARLAALSVKQTISGTTLMLSNGAPQGVLSLFR